MYTEQRKAGIIELIEKEGSIHVNSLAERFGISRETIRRDLSELERQGLLKRTHGGAVLEEIPVVGEYPINIRGIRQSEEKNEICRRAAEMICEGDTLFIDNSSTMLYLPKHIPKNMQLTIITNSINFLLEAGKVANHNWLMICLGGIFSPRNLSVHGSATLKNAEEYYPSKTFFSCTGVSSGNMITDTSVHEIETKRMMISRAQETFWLADHTKFEKSGQISLCNFAAVNYAITDAKAKDLGFLEKSGIELIVVG